MGDKTKIEWADKTFNHWIWGKKDSQCRLLDGRGWDEVPV